MASDCRALVLAFRDIRDPPLMVRRGFANRANTRFPPRSRLGRERTTFTCGHPDRRIFDVSLFSPFSEAKQNSLVSKQLIVRPVRPQIGIRIYRLACLVALRHPALLFRRATSRFARRPGMPGRPLCERGPALRQCWFLERLIV